MTTTPTCCCWRVPHAATARGRTGPTTTREAKPQELDFPCPPPSVSGWWTRMVGWLLLSKMVSPSFLPSFLQGSHLCPLCPPRCPREWWQGPAVTSVSPGGFCTTEGSWALPVCCLHPALGEERAETGLNPLLDAGFVTELGWARSSTVLGQCPLVTSAGRAERPHSLPTLPGPSWGGCWPQQC